MFKALAEIVTRPLIRHLPFRSSADYWERRYKLGGISGRGSRTEAGLARAEFVNRFVAQHDVREMIEFGCGDGEQAALLDCPVYTGFDISHAALRQCRKRFRDDPARRFLHVSEYDGEQADLTLSMQVILHLVEDEVFTAYMHRLFDASRRFVLIHSTNEDRPGEAPHVRHRAFTPWVTEHIPAFRLMAREKGHDAAGKRQTPSAFFVYERDTPA